MRSTPGPSAQFCGSRRCGSPGEPQVGTLNDSGVYLTHIGRLVRDARHRRGWTQARLAATLRTSQSAITRIEQGRQNLSLEMLVRIGQALGSEIVSPGHSGPMHLRVEGVRQLSRSINVKTSKNAGVALPCAALLNRGRTVLRRAQHRQPAVLRLDRSDRPRFDADPRLGI